MYRSRADKEDAKWMPISDVLARIQSVDGVSLEEAQKQLAKLATDFPGIWRSKPSGPGGGRALSETIYYDPPQILKEMVDRHWTAAPNSPAIKPQSGVADDPPPNVSIQEWMQTHAQNAKLSGRLAKRDVAIQECMTATHCRWRDALSAWQSLPGELKRSPRQTDRAL